MKVLIALVVIFILVFGYAIYQRRKYYRDYLNRKEDDQRRFGDRNKPYWRK